jgi:hypothetical protein
MVLGAHITIPRHPKIGRVIYESLLAAPHRLADVGALQTNVRQQTIIQLAQLLFSIGACQISLQLAHQARCSVKAIVANGLAAHGNRRHIFYSSFYRRLSCLSLSPNLLCVAQFIALSSGTSPREQASLLPIVMRILHNEVHTALTFIRFAFEE